MRTAEKAPQETQFGYYKPTEKINITDLGGVFRIYEYTNKLTGHTSLESVYMANKKDISKVYTGYDGARCHSCFAGHPHSIERHLKDIQ